MAGAAAAVSLTDGFSAGLAVACRVSAGLASGLASGLGATRTTDGCGLASATLGFAAAGGGGALAGVASALRPMPTLRARLEKKPSDCCGAGAAAATRVGGVEEVVGGVEEVVATATTGSSGCARFGFGGLTVDGMVPGARVSASVARTLAVAAFGQAGVTFRNFGGEDLVHAAVDAGIEPRHRGALGDQLGSLGRLLLLPLAHGIGNLVGDHIGRAFG